MEFILAQQAQFWASMQKHEETQAEWQIKHERWQDKHEEWQKRAEVRIDNGSFRVDRLERILKLMIKPGQRARRIMRERDQKLDRRFAEVAEMIAAGEQAQARSDRKLESLLDLVREQRIGAA
ncbi:MAG: hypothetical protein JWM21_3070 [Acidobacteria bacterium]|nr:hypothetical protein [Acidobacteriota bacterium]